MGEREREREREIEGVQDSGTLFKLRRVETSITGGAAAAEPPGTDTTDDPTVVPLQPSPLYLRVTTIPSTRTTPRSYSNS